MQTADLVKYMNNPALLDKQSVEQLQNLVQEFPYFQSAHLLLSLASKKWDPVVYQQSLKKTAIVTSNRSHLFQLIYQLEDQKPEAEVKPKEIVKETVKQETVVTEQRTEQVPLVVEQKEEAKQELEILKTAEIVAETKPEVVEAKTKTTAEEILEKEIEKNVVTAFVEKELLKVPELEKPVTQQEDPESFGDWLSFLKKNNGQSYEEIEEQVHTEQTKKQLQREEKVKAETAKIQERKEKNRALIDKIIETSPGIIRQKEDQKFFAADAKAKESLLENEHLVTETLARIYALQGSVNKAVRAYEILSLKYPQKSAYFAGLIQKLKNNQ